MAGERVTRRVAIRAAVNVLDHVPDLVRYGSKPWRDLGGDTDELRFQTGSEAAGYLPHRVFLGRERPELLWDMPRPWWSVERVAGEDAGPGWLDQPGFYELLRRVDDFELIDWTPGIDTPPGHLEIRNGPSRVGSVGPAHDLDEALQPMVLLENLTCKATGVHALELLIAESGLDPSSIDYVISAGEEAVGDRYQRGGGGVAKAIAEASGAMGANGSDLKAFCAAPVHALVMGASLVAAGTFDRVVVVAGGSFAKLGMKYLGVTGSGGPVLGDVLAGFAAVLEPAADQGPVVRLDAVGSHRIGSGASQQALLNDIVVTPLAKLGLRFGDIDVYATELHNPDITEPSGGGNVPNRNYRMLAGMAVLAGQLDASDLDDFVGRRGLPGFAPLQGHIASAVPWLVHALPRFADAELRRTMLLAKGSLFLGRLTRMWDGISVVLEA